jgi:hypothetical protein
MPVLPLLLSSFALVFGKTPMEVAQVIIPFLSSCAIILIYLITFRFTKNELVAYFAGLALALNGFYVYLGAAVMKETVGLVLLLLGVYLYYGREDPRKRVLAGILLLILSLTHHLTVWIAFVMVSFLFLSSNVLHWHHGSFQKRRFIVDFLSGPFLFTFTITYYNIVELAFFNRVSNLNDIALFASVFMVGVIFCIIYSLPKKRRKPGRILFNKTLIIPIVGGGLLILNRYKRIFPGTIRTTTPLLIYMIPYILLLSVALIGLNVVANRKTEHKPFIASIILGPLVVILFAMLKGFDVFTFILIYRSYDYIDFGVAICAGIGAGFLINGIARRFTKKDDTSEGRLSIKAALSIVFLAICLATVPLAYHGQEFYGVQDATYNYEFASMRWLAENSGEYQINTDERISDIINPYFDLDSEKTLPWRLKYGKALDSQTMIFVEDKWLEEGAQMSPMEPIVISEKTFDRTLSENDIIYSSAGGASQIYIALVK